MKYERIIVTLFALNEITKSFMEIVYHEIADTKCIEILFNILC